MSSAETLVQASCSRYVAGLILTGDRVTAAAPILRRHVMGLSGEELRAWAARNGVTLHRVPAHSQAGNIVGSC